MSGGLGYDWESETSFLASDGYDWELVCYGHTPLSIKWHYLSSRDINERPSHKTGSLRAIAVLLSPIGDYR